MQIYRPLQISFCNRVLEKGRKFYFTASATLGVRLPTGEALLEFEQIKDAFECMGDPPLPDVGMPKPNGEVLVSGKCFAKDNKPVPANEVRLEIGPVKKTLYVMGDRIWKQSGGLGAVISDPEPFTEMEISWSRAFGGEGYTPNPHGKGCAPVKGDKGGMAQPLPNVLDPKKLIGSPSDRPEPVGLAPLDPSLPTRMRFAGTYNQDYKRKYYPGYPEDMDWRHFLCAPEDQWIDDFFIGNESFCLTNMHPTMPRVEGNLPGYWVRLFILREREEKGPEFAEISMNLDTVWFFPEKLMALLIWRKGIEVRDDEAEEITHVLAAYEDRSHPPRDLEHYKAAMEKRMNGNDPLLNELNTSDLIPVGSLCAMEILFKMGLEGGGESELAKNMGAKSEAMQKEVDEKIEEAVAQSEKKMEAMDMPNQASDQLPDEAKVDLRKMVENKPEVEPDPDVAALKQKLDSILPGIMAGDPAQLDIKEFSFDKIDKIAGAISEFGDKKKKEVMDLTREEIAKSKDEIGKKLDSIKEGADAMDDKAQKEMEEKIQETYKALEALDQEENPEVALPRFNAEEVIGQMSDIPTEPPPELLSAIEHLNSARAAGIEDENTRDLEDRIQEAMEGIKTAKEKTGEALLQAESQFKDGYIMAAHMLSPGLSPHKEPVEKVAEKFLAAVAQGEDVSNGDWACLDLSGQDLAGVNLSGCFLEQVNFARTSLKGANLSKAIMARANLENADLTGANLEGTNLGAARATRANFTEANLDSAKLTRGVFKDADFTRAELKDAESLEVVISGSSFAGAHMPGMTFLEAEIAGTGFPGADLTAGAFISCDIRDCDFTGAVMNRCAFSDTKFTNVVFDEADLSGACFTAKDPEKKESRGLRFKGARVVQSSFMDMDMQGADFTGAVMINSNFMGADLSGADLSGANAKSAMFKKANLAGAKLDGINLMEGSLSKAYLVNASFARANLYAVDFLRSTITNTDFRDSNLESTIIEGWRPK